MVLAPNFILTYTLLFLAFSSSSTFAQINEFFPHEQDALIQLRKSVSSAANLPANWTGQPCAYNESKWLGVSCSKGHVVGLVLEGIQLQGSPPKSFLQNLRYLNLINLRNNSISGPLPVLTDLAHLEFVFMSHNGFTGSIPVGYITLRKLKVLELEENFLDGEIPPFDQPTLVSFNVSYNHLRGDIPRTHLLQSFPRSSFDHNSDVCGSPLDVPCPVPPAAPLSMGPTPPPMPRIGSRQGNNKTGLEIWKIVFLAAASAMVVLLIVIILICYCKKCYGKAAINGDWQERGTITLESSGSSEKSVDLTFFNKDISLFDMEDLLRASANVLGNGNLGITFKAVLESGSVYAVKRLQNMRALKRKVFIQQIQTLGKLRHENLVQIITFHYSQEQKLVIYEYIPKGSLFKLLHENRSAEKVPLGWDARLSIVKDIAKALVFLHQSLRSQKVPHANLKSSNVFVYQDNQKYHSKLTDYGYYPILQAQKLSEKLAIGKSPEFYEGKKITKKADVYCFGIVLLEIITGKIPGEVAGGCNEKMDDLSDWVRMVVNKDWSTDILDVDLLGSREGHNEMLKLTKIALDCTNVEPEKRPKMSEVLGRIEEIEQEGR